MNSNVYLKSLIPVIELWYAISKELEIKANNHKNNKFNQGFYQGRSEALKEVITLIKGTKE